MAQKSILHLGFNARHAWKSQTFFRPLAQATIDHLGIKGGIYLDVSLVDRAMIRRLNRQYRQLDKVTDVISFALEEGPQALTHAFKGRHLGDIFLCYCVIADQARLSEQSVDSALAFTFIHGLLHLLGYDHQDDLSEQRMNKLTYQLIARCGYEKEN